MVVCIKMIIHFKKHIPCEYVFLKCFGMIWHLILEEWFSFIVFKAIDFIGAVCDERVSL